MTSNQPPVPPAEDAAKEDEVLQREGVEEKLMQEDRSEVGEHISGVDGQK